MNLAKITKGLKGTKVAKAAKRTAKLGKAIKSARKAGKVIVGARILKKTAETESVLAKAGPFLKPKRVLRKAGDYKGTFFKKHPELEGKVVVHHGVEQQVLKRPETKGLFTENEMHSYDNLRGIPKEVNSDLHLSKIRKEWNKFYRENPSPSKEDLLKKRQEIDDKYGHLFNPPK